MDKFIVTKTIVKILTQPVDARNAVSAGEKARKNKKGWEVDSESTEEYRVEREESINKIGF